VLVERESLGGDGRTGEVPGEALAPVEIAGLEPDLGVER
jgi:hypothetical protein